MSKETIPEYLRRMRRKDDDEKSLVGGWRSTREVAEYCGISLGTARRRLIKSNEAGEIEVMQSICEPGSPLIWRAETAK